MYLTSGSSDTAFNNSGLAEETGIHNYKGIIIEIFITDYYG